MKIAMIGQKGVPISQGGGVEKHVQELAVRLAEMNTVIAYTRPQYTPTSYRYYFKVKLVSLPSIATKHLDTITHTFLAIVHATLKEKVDIVHIHSVGPALLTWLPRLLRPKTQVIVTFHSMDRQHQKWGKFARFMLWLGEWIAMKFAQEVITVSKALQSYTFEMYGRLTTYIPNGIAEMNIVPAKMITNQFGLTPNNYILAVNRLVRHKGVHHLIKAYQQLNTDKKLVIAGGSVFTDHYVQELHALANGNPNIIFTGNQTGTILAELFSNSYCYVLPSESEGLSIALLEAAAYGKTVIAADIPANAEIVMHCGMSFKCNDIQDLKAKLEQALINSAVVAQTGTLGQKYVLAHYHWDDIAKRTNRLYQQVQSVVFNKLTLPAS